MSSFGHTSLLCCSTSSWNNLEVALVGLFLGGMVLYLQMIHLSMIARRFLGSCLAEEIMVFFYLVWVVFVGVVGAGLVGGISGV